MDGKLSWPFWLTNSGKLDHTAVTQPASSLKQDRESSPAETSMILSMLCCQLVLPAPNGYIDIDAAPQPPPPPASYHYNFQFLFNWWPIFPEITPGYAGCPKVTQQITFGDCWCNTFTGQRHPSCHPNNSVKALEEGQLRQKQTDTTA